MPLAPGSPRKRPGKDRRMPGKGRRPLKPGVMGVSLEGPSTDPVIQVAVMGVSLACPALTNPVMEVGLCMVVRDLAEFAILAGEVKSNDGLPIPWHMGTLFLYRFQLDNPRHVCF